LLLSAAACGRIPPPSTANLPPPWPAPPPAVETGPAPPVAPPPPRSSFDRSQMPRERTAAPLVLPTPLRRTLKGGTPVLIVERHALPVATVAVVWPTGAADEPPDQAGLAGLTADLLDEGAGRRGALELAEEVAHLGARLETLAHWDATTVTATTLTRVLDPVLALVADVVMRPSFAARELERVRNDRLTQLVQERDLPQRVGADLLSLLLYGERHRYGRPLVGSDATLAGLGRAAVVKWHAERLRADTATLIVVGDVQADDLVRRLDAAFAGWKPPPRRPSLAHPPVALPPPARRAVVVDRPGAAQTELRVGLPCVERTSPDYFPLLVMNAVLGGSFTSRLNTNLREKHGYTYGARSEVSFRRGGGPFAAATPVKTAVTRASVEETLGELERLRAAEVAPGELRLAKDLLERTLARTFETPPEVAAALAAQVTYGLADDYYATYAAHVEAVTAADVHRVAERWIVPAKMPIVLVGDRSQIAGSLEPLVGKLEPRDAAGRPLE
jgi:predicted Zn-dependent peptidase